MKDILVQIAAVLDSDYRDKYVDKAVLKWVFDQVVDYLDIREHVINGFEFGGESPMLLASGGYNSKEKKIQFFDISLRNSCIRQVSQIQYPLFSFYRIGCVLSTQKA